MSELVIEQLRGPAVESRHRVSAAVVDSEGRLLAYSGYPHLVTFMRSAAKPFQALPLIEDGAAERFAVSSEEIALACASHNSEPHQVELVQAFLQRIGATEADLACGPHRPLSAELALVDADGATSAGGGSVAGQSVERVPRSPLASNCSGKHTAMLAVAKHAGWPTAGYHLSDHPVQQRCRSSVARWAEVPESSLAEAVDGCGVVTFALPLSRMALAYARLAASSEPAALAVTRAMIAHPELVAGKGRLCTALMQRYPGRVLAKIGAEGVYGAALLDRGIGIALKVEDGHNWSAVVALLVVLETLGLDPPPRENLAQFARIPLRNTRGEIVGSLQPSGGLRRV